jgi:DNA-binding response OmpR family regulator
MSKSIHILLVEDDPNLGFVVKDNLEEHGYTVTHCDDGQRAEEVLQDNTFDLCLFDVMLPKKDGFSLAETLRKTDQHTPIIFLTAKEMQEDKNFGFKIGGDDYITKPFDFDELIFRIEAVLKRSHSTGAPRIKGKYRLGIFAFDPEELQLTTDTSTIRLTKKEAALLKYLADHLNTPLKREEVLMEIWGDDNYFLGRSMDVYITKLRKYLREDPSIEIANIHGVGFKMSIS